VDRALGAC
jgi:hypothetical protein